MKLIDLTGNIFGRLTVSRRIEDHISPSGRRYPMWEAYCSCGNPIPVKASGDNLRSGKVKSCGCLRVDNMHEIRKSMSSENIYDLNGEYGIGVATNTDRVFYFDIEDYEKIKNYKWFDNGNYMVSCPDGENTIFMHNIIMKPNKGERVDHREHKTYDNRKSQMRIGSISDNAVNRTKPSNNTSNIVGVSWHKPTGKWAAYITKDKVRHYLGEYKNKQDAISARKAAEEKLFGKWSYDNSVNTKV